MLVKDYIYQIYSRWVKANQYWAICRRCDKQAFNSALWHYINNNKHDQLLDVFWKELHSEMVLIFKPIFINFFHILIMHFYGVKQGKGMTFGRE